MSKLCCCTSPEVVELLWASWNGYIATRRVTDHQPLNTQRINDSMKKTLIHTLEGVY